MVTKVVPGLLIATPDAAQAAHEACARITKSIHEAIRDRGAATIALSGGSSPLDAYRLLAKATIDWNKVHVYWVDERAVPPTHDRSNYGQAKKALLDPAAHPRGEHPSHARRGLGSRDAPPRDYEAELRETVKAKLGGLPSLDLLVMGIGDDGHTASLFPGDRTMYVTDKLVAAVPRDGGPRSAPHAHDADARERAVERGHRARQGRSTPRSSASGRPTATSTRRPAGSSAASAARSAG